MVLDLTKMFSPHFDQIVHLFQYLCLLFKILVVLLALFGHRNELILSAG